MVSRSRDVAFHMNPRVREGIVVRNSMIGGNWGQEERELSMNPFMEGQYFDVSSIHIFIDLGVCVVSTGLDFFLSFSLRCQFAVGTRDLRSL